MTGDSEEAATYYSKVKAGRIDINYFPVVYRTPSS